MCERVGRKCLLKELIVVGDILRYWVVDGKLTKGLYQLLPSFPIPLGLGPYWFSPGLLSVQYQTRRSIPPTIGISPIRRNQPLFPMSCRRRAETARSGMNMAIYQIQMNAFIRGASNAADRMPRKMAMPIEQRVAKSFQYQYSERRARPLKSA